MSHERIIATVLFIADRSNCIDGGAIAFKRAFRRSEGEAMLMGVNQYRHVCFHDSFQFHFFNKKFYT